MKPITLSEYARRRGVSKVAVSKAIKAGRLRASVVFVSGRPAIGDPELADTEWHQNTQPRIDQPRKEARRAVPQATPRDADATAEDVPPYETSRAVREAAAARRENALADLAEIEVSEKLDEIVPVAEVEAYMADKFTVVKTRILGVPTRVAQELPHIAAEVAPVLERHLREVLEELAAEDAGDEEGAELE